MYDRDDDEDGGGGGAPPTPGMKPNRVLEKVLRDSQRLTGQAATLRSIQTTLNKLLDLHERAEAKNRKLKAEYLTRGSASITPIFSDEPETPTEKVRLAKRRSRNQLRPKIQIEPLELPAVGMVSPDGITGPSMSTEGYLQRGSNSGRMSNPWPRAV
nr:unnamed protein product [Spirometra erinaceieuropaei]